MAVVGQVGSRGPSPSLGAHGHSQTQHSLREVPF